MSRLFVSPDTEWVGRVAWAAGEEQPFEHLAAPQVDLPEVIRVVERDGIRVVVVGPGLADTDAATLVRYLSDNRPTLEIVQWVTSDQGAILAALRNGATDIATDELSPEDIASEIERLEQRNLRRWEATNAVDENDQHRVTVVASPRGGVGRTTIACALGHLLDLESDGDVVLVDLDLQCGDVADVFGLAPNLTFASIAGRVGELDSADIKAILSKPDMGPHVLAAPESLTSSVQITADLAGAAVKLLSASFRHVVIDSGTHLNETTLAALDQATDLVLVCAPDVPSVRALARATEALDELQVLRPTRHLVLNKASDRYGMPVRDIESVSGMTPISQVAASKDIAMTLNMGAPFDEVVHAKSPLARGLKPLVRELSPGGHRGGRRRGLIGRRR